MYESFTIFFLDFLYFVLATKMCLGLFFFLIQPFCFVLVGIVEEHLSEVIKGLLVMTFWNP